MTSKGTDFSELISKLVPCEDPGNIPLSFRLGDRIIKGIPSDFMPLGMVKETDDILKYIISGKTETGLEIIVHYTEYKDFPCVEWIAYLKNKGSENTEIISDLKILSDTVIPGENPKIIYSNGETYTEEGYSIFEKELGKEEFVLSPDEGTPCAFASPYFRLKFKDHCVSMGIGWPGKWQLNASANEDGAVLSLGQAKLNSYLKPGEVFRTPRIAMLYSDGGETEAANLWRRWFFKHICPKTDGQDIKPMLALWQLDSLYDWHIHDTEESQCERLNRFMSHGIKPDVWWIDAGWYKYSGEWITVGTWKHDEKRFPNGLAPIGELCQKNNIRFLLWFEPERAYPGTEIGDNYPQYLLKTKEPVGFFPGSMLFDFSNPEACEYMTDLIDKRIKEYKVTIYRQDFNMPPLKYWEENDEENRQGSHENLHIQGYLKFWDDLKARNPGLLFDSCASGGKRNDLEALSRAFPMHYSDIGYGKHTVCEKQHHFLFMWTPYFRELNWSWDKEDGEYGGIDDARHTDSFSYHCAFAPMLSDEIENTDEGYARALKYQPIWREAAELMISGDYYPLSRYDARSEDWFAIQFDDNEASKGFIQLISNVKCHADSVTLFPKTDDNKTYLFRNPENGESFKINSEELRKGLTLKTSVRSGQIWFYEKK